MPKPSDDSYLIICIIEHITDGAIKDIKKKHSVPIYVAAITGATRALDLYLLKKGYTLMEKYGIPFHVAKGWLNTFLVSTYTPSTNEWATPIDPTYHIIKADTHCPYICGRPTENEKNIITVLEGLGYMDTTTSDRNEQHIQLLQHLQVWAYLRLIEYLKSNSYTLLMYEGYNYAVANEYVDTFNNQFLEGAERWMYVRLDKAYQYTTKAIPISW